MEQLTAISTDQLLQETQQLIANAKNFLISEGKVVEFGKFLTIKRYCEKYNIKDESRVTNWIRRNIIPAEDVHTFPELNNLRMIRDKSYKI